MARTVLAVLAAALASSPLLTLAATPATENIGVVAVGDPPAGPSPELADLARSFRKVLAASYPGVVGSEELRQRMEGHGASASLTELDRAINGAVAAFQAGDYERCARTLRAVIEDLERLPPGDQAFAMWRRAVMRLARAEGSLGRKGESREAMERLLRADPAATPDPELYPPSFGRQIDEVRAELRAKPRRKLVVNAGGAAARVFVEGRFVGDAPITLSVSPGRYRVAGTLKDGVSTVRVAELSTEDQTVVLDFSIAEVLRPAAGPGLAIIPAKRATTSVAAGAALKLDRVFALSLVMDGDVRYLVGSVYDVQKGSLQREGRVRVSSDVSPEKSLAALAGFLQTGEPSTLVITRPEPAKAAKPIAITPVPGPQAPGTRSAQMLKWSPVATAGLAVVLGGFAVWQGGQARGKYSDADALLRPDGTLADVNRPTYDGIRSDGDALKRNAYIGAAGAATAVAATAILSYISYKRTGEVGPFRF